MRKISRLLIAACGLVITSAYGMAQIASVDNQASFTIHLEGNLHNLRPHQIHDYSADWYFFPHSKEVFIRKSTDNTPVGYIHDTGTPCANHGFIFTATNLLSGQTTQKCVTDKMFVFNIYQVALRFTDRRIKILW